MADAKLQITITTDNQDSIKKINEVVKSLDGVVVSSKSVEGSQKSMAGEVFKGVAAWDMLKKGIGVAQDFIMGSIKASVEAESKMNLVRAVVQSMGKAYQDVGPQISEFGAKMASMGRDDEDAALAMVKLAKVAGGDLKKGMDLAKLASDLTASGFGDLQGNVDNLSRILSGKGARALLEYRINLSDSATTSEQLAAVQGKVTRKTEEWANTTEGKIATMTTQWENFRENIGKVFGPTMNKMLSDFNSDLGNTSGAMETWSDRAGKNLAKVYESIKGIPAIFGKIWSDTHFASQNMSDSLNKNFDETINKIAAVDDEVKKMAEAQKSNSIDVQNANEAAAKAAEDAAQKIEDLKTKVKDFGKEAEDTNYRIATTVREYKEKQEKLLSSLLDKVKEINKQIQSENEDYAKSQADNLEELKKNIGEEIVSHEDKKTELEKQLNEEVAKGADANQEKLNDLRNEIDTEKKFLEKHKATIQKYELDIAKIRDNAHKDEVEKMIMDYDEKKLIDQKAHEEKLAKLQEDLAKENQAYRDSLNEQIRDTNQALDEIKRTYEQKFAEISAIVGRSGALQTQINKINQGVQSSTTVSGYQFYKYANKEEIYRASDNYHIPSWDAFIAAGGATDLSNVMILPARALGGPVSANQPYLVGERGAEVFIPGQSGRISPDVGGTTINISITGNTLLDRQAAEKIGDMIVKKLKLNLKL